TAGDTGTVVLDSFGAISGGAAILIDGGTVRGNNNLNLTLILLNASSVNIAAGTTLDVYGSQAAANGLSGAGTVTTSLAGVPATLIVNHWFAAPAPTTFSGIIRDGASPLSLVVDTHDLILTGANAYSGTTSIRNAGTLEIGNGGTGG
ncbi:autotransporter-associated beta strand repeat-containing protein, partial [Xanthomonas citri pv. citri]